MNALRMAVLLAPVPPEALRRRLADAADHVTELLELRAQRPTDPNLKRVHEEAVYQFTGHLAVYAGVPERGGPAVLPAPHGDESGRLLRSLNQLARVTRARSAMLNGAITRARREATAH